MKTYKQVLVTGILLTASAMMFMGQAYDDYYDRKIWRSVQNIESTLYYGLECNGGYVDCN